MILRINAIGKVNAPVFSLKNYKNHDTKLQYEADKNTEINGVPRSYVTFRGDDKTLNYSEDANLPVQILLPGLGLNSSNSLPLNFLI